MAFMLSKIVKRLFRHVYVNRSGIEKVSWNFSYCICYPVMHSRFTVALQDEHIHLPSKITFTKDWVCKDKTKIAIIPNALQL